MLSSVELRARRISGPISTDDILPARYKHMFTDPQQYVEHIFESYYPGFSDTLRNDDILISDDIFGIGSSREQAVTALLAAGVRVVVAPAFGRIFYRNSWNNGLFALQLNVDEFVEHEIVTLNIAAGTLQTASHTYLFSPPVGHLLEVRKAGGLMQFIKANT